MSVEFAYEPVKSAANKHKHGIDFDEAQALWADVQRVEIPARVDGEPRWMVIGRIGRKVYSAVVTDRDGRVRFISVRRSRKEEVGFYEA